MSFFGGGYASAFASLAGAGEEASAIKQAGQDQLDAAEGQLGLDSGIFNAQANTSSTTRALGGLAQQSLAYLMGLSPNLNISSDLETPQLTTSGTNTSLSYNPYAPTAGTPVATAPGSTGSSWGTNPIATMGTAAQPGAGVSFGGSTIPNSAGSASSGAYGSLTNPYNPSTFYQDPGYNFILSQNENAINSQMASKGLSLSPAALNEALTYSSGLASQEFNNAYSRSMTTQQNQYNELAGLAGSGQTASNALSSAAGSAGAAGSSALSSAGNALSSTAIGTGNAIAGGINGVTNSLNSAALNSSILGGGSGSGSWLETDSGSSVPAGYYSSS